MDQDKVTAVTDCSIPTTIPELQRILGFVNFYWRFIRSFNIVASPLTILLKKKGSERLNPSANQSFECLKEASLSTPIIKHRDPSKPFTLEVDASATALRSVLSQRIWRKT